MNREFLIFWVLTLFFWGISPTLEKIGLKKLNPLLGLWIRTLSAFLGITLALFLTNSFYEIKTLEKRDFFILGISGITAGFLGMFFYFSLLKNYPASQVVPLSATYPLVSTLMAILFLKEPLTFSKLLGTFLIVLGIYLLFKN